MSASDELTCTFTELGEKFTPSEELVKKWKISCAPYIVNTRETSMKHGSHPSASRLRWNACFPPTEDAHRKHVFRTGYQAGMWRKSLETEIAAPSPDGHGWYLEDGQLVIKLMTQNPALDNVLLVANCSCARRRCDSARRSCRNAQVFCTDLCGCKTCMKCESRVNACRRVTCIRGIR